MQAASALRGVLIRTPCKSRRLYSACMYSVCRKKFSDPKGFLGGLCRLIRSYVQSEPCSDFCWQGMQMAAFADKAMQESDVSGRDWMGWAKNRSLPRLRIRLVLVGKKRTSCGSGKDP